ncbi:MAG: D-alanyl-D-alanine dipeptidase, partial [Pedobacter sp.]|nr:D-alanyl-D-alanine dipeptidase [Pedobacter sp.]
MRVFLIFLLFTNLLNGASGQSAKKNRLYVQGFKAYQVAVKKDKKKELVEIKSAIPSVKLDIRYATTNNFMHQVMYQQARAFARKEV